MAVAEGAALTLASPHRKLTTQEAADLLGVSRPHLIKLLGRGDIPYTKTGTHRRVLLQDVLTFRDERFRRAGEVLKAMVDEEKDWELSDTVVSPLSRKLQLKAGYRALLLDPPSEYVSMLQPLPAEVSLTEDPIGEFDFVQLFVKQRADLDARLATALAAVKPDGLLWICYPKGGAKAGTDLNRDLLWAVVQSAGWTGVTLIAVDNVWSAMRFRPADRVRSTRSGATN